MFDFILSFHFLRPEWLLALPIILFLGYYIRKQTAQNQQNDQVIADHLKHALTPKQTLTNKIKPIDLTIILGCILCIAVSGPAWRPLSNQEANKAPIVIVLKLSKSMLANDLSPSRLSRAKQKIADLLSYRTGSKHSLIVYANSSHRVLPFTEDNRVFEPFIEALSPTIMPNNQATFADDLDNALSLAKQEATNVGGTILVIADEINRAQVAALKRTKTPFIWWQFATEKGGVIFDDQGHVLAQADGQPLIHKLDTSSRNELPFVTSIQVSISNHDLQNIADYAASNYTQFAKAQGIEYQDMAWHFVWLVALLSLFWFRKGWTTLGEVSTSRSIKSIASLTIIFAFSGSINKAYAHPIDLFLTPDQQGALAYKQLKFDKAAAHFSDANWRAKALYENGNYREAADVYATLGTIEGFYNRATALLKAHEYALAIEAFEQVLSQSPDFKQAQQNLAIAKQAYKVVLSQAGNEDLEQNIALDVDENRLAEESTGDFVDYQVTDSLSPEAKEQWMRSVESDMADFLASKFANDLTKRKN